MNAICYYLNVYDIFVNHVIVILNEAKYRYRYRNVMNPQVLQLWMFFAITASISARHKLHSSKDVLDIHPPDSMEKSSTLTFARHSFFNDSVGLFLLTYT